MTLPEFLTIGAMKAGTTSLFHYLDSHPGIFMPSTKEVHFFVYERNWLRGKAWYEAQFKDAPAGSLAGEASPSYTNFPQWQGVPARIASLLPNVRLIYLVRDPVERMKSHYRHEVISRRETKPIDEALTPETSYFYRSCYALQVEQYLPHVSRDRIFILDSDELRMGREASMAHVFEFLGLNSVSLPEGEFHRSADKRRRSPLSAVVRSLPGYGAASRALPERVKARLGGLVYRPGRVPDTNLSASREGELRAALRPDIERFAAMMPSGFDGWGYLSDSPPKLLDDAD